MGTEGHAAGTRCCAPLSLGRAQFGGTLSSLLLPYNLSLLHANAFFLHQRADAHVKTGVVNRVMALLMSGTSAVRSFLPAILFFSSAR
jgi:hypothetical protein